MPSRRNLALDALRGLFLVLMTFTHLPTRARGYSHEALGFVSAAEGFVFLSAFLVGSTYMRRADKLGWPAVRRSMLQRAGKLYAIHLVIMVVAFLIAGLFAERPGMLTMFDFLLDQPARALLAAPLLVYCPPFFDILPMYILFMAASPFLLQLGARRGLGSVLAVSGLLWVAAQLGAREFLQERVGALLGGVPASAFGAFSVLGWQLMWTLGLCVGASEKAQRALTKPFSVRTLTTAFALSAVFLAVRYSEALFGVTIEVPYALEKWRLAPLRLLNMLCLAVVFVQLSAYLVRAGGTLFALLGRASLPLFCAHIVLSILSILLIDDLDLGLPFEQEFLVIIVTFGALFAIAHWQDRARVPSPGSHPPSVIAS